MSGGRASSIHSPDLCKVWEIKTLGRQRDAEARRLLQKVAAQVQPIMRKRRWRVLVLSEFSPRNPALLGLNVGGGQEIKIRLRRHDRDSEFFQYQSILGTMLHELTHNDHGPHDGKFYKLLDEITKECDELMAKGITGTGQGFDAPGKRLGGYSHNPAESNLRKVALAAAEKRQLLGSLMPSGPRRVGGDSEIRNSLTPAQAAAMAAERRLKDDLWCAAPETVGENGIEKARDREATIQIGDNEQHEVQCDAQEVLQIKKQAKPSGKSFQNQAMADSDTWECSLCTLLNPPLAPICAACGSQNAGGTNANREVWQCKFCTSETPKLLERCATCNEWRYSTGTSTSYDS